MSINKDELNKILKKHKLWLYSFGFLGKRADLSDADLRFDNLRGVVLRNANLRYTGLSGANLRYADLRNANLEDAYLRFADLRDANLRFADLKYADLEGANLENTGIYFFKGPRHNGIYNSKDDKLYIGCQVHSLDYWLENYVAIGKKYKYTDEEREVYGAWIKSLKEIS